MRHPFGCASPVNPPLLPVLPVMFGRRTSRVPYTRAESIPATTPSERLQEVTSETAAEALRIVMRRTRRFSNCFSKRTIRAVCMALRVQFSLHRSDCSLASNLDDRQKADRRRLHCGRLAIGAVRPGRIDVDVRSAVSTPSRTASGIGNDLERSDPRHTTAVRTSEFPRDVRSVRTSLAPCRRGYGFSSIGTRQGLFRKANFILKKSKQAKQQPRMWKRTSFTRICRPPRMVQVLRCNPPPSASCHASKSDAGKQADRCRLSRLSSPVKI